MRRLLVIAVSIAVFAAVSLVLARWLTAPGAERDRVVELLRAQARGDVPAMLARLDGCLSRPACVGTVHANAARLRARGGIEVVAYDSPTAYSLGSARGATRVVWRTPGRLTTVQCVEVRRDGNVLSGPSVSLTSLSAPIRRTAGC
jgi:hypothetical protein